MEIAMFREAQYDDWIDFFPFSIVMELSWNFFI